MLSRPPIRMAAQPPPEVLMPSPITRLLYLLIRDAAPAGIIESLVDLTAQGDFTEPNPMLRALADQLGDKLYPRQILLLAADTLDAASEELGRPAVLVADQLRNLAGNIGFGVEVEVEPAEL